MKPFVLTIPMFLLLFGCQRADSTASSDKNVPEMRDVTLVSHLAGALADDPELIPGQTIRLLPHETEPLLQFVLPQETEPPFGRKKPVIVTLPSTTPFDGRDAQFFLRGFAVGKLFSTKPIFL